MDDFIYLNCKTFEVKIYVSGIYDEIVRSCQEYVMKGLCVSIKKVDYIYTMGMESGAEITLINYPRFPRKNPLIELNDIAVELGNKVTKDCFQGSYTIVGPNFTVFATRRSQDVK